MLTFGIIGEGITDQIVIENVIYGFFGKDEPEGINYLQPLRDHTDSFGNWYNVIEYCRSERLKTDMEDNDYIIIQIDTDTSDEKNYDISKLDENNQELAPEQLIENVTEKLKNLIIKANSSIFFDFYQKKIIFAIAVHSTECWLLPLYTVKKSDIEATKNCHNRLEKILKRVINKDFRTYNDLSKPFIKQKELYKIKDKNPSLNFFVDNLERQVIIE
jgi:hypothetical protein